MDEILEAVLNGIMLVGGICLIITAIVAPALIINS